MAWKPKEKQLTPEEAIALAKRELAPYWFGSTPLLAGVAGPDGGIAAHPLDTAFTQKAWLLFFIDPTDFAGEAALVFAREWHKRYSPEDLGFLIVFKPPYAHLRTPDAVNAFIRKNQLTFPVVVDFDEKLTGAFHANALPKVLLIDHGKPGFEASGKKWLEQTELKVQTFLRTTDPGLPLYPVYDPGVAFVKDLARLEFGRGGGIRFPAPGFAMGDAGFGTARFAGEKPATLRAGSFFISGAWMQDGERIATSDPHAVVAFKSPAARVSIIAQSLSKRAEVAKVAVEVNGVPAYESYAGEHMTLDEEGQSLVRIEGGHLYHVLAALPEKERDITLSFPAADRVPVALYALRFGD